MKRSIIILNYCIKISAEVIRILLHIDDTQENITPENVRDVNLGRCV